MLHSRSDQILAVVEYPSLNESFRKPCPDSFTAAISPDGRLLAMSYRGDVFVYDVDLGEQIAESIGHHSETINDLRFGPKGDWIATTSDDRTVRLWDFRSQEPPALLGAHPNGVPRALAVSMDGRTLLTNSRSGEVWSWSVQASQKLFPICRAESGYKETLLSADDSTLATVDETGLIVWYAITTGDVDSGK
jgi:WD40 repeat protein